MDNALRALTFALGGLSFVLIAWTLWRLRKPHPLRWFTPLIAIAGSVGAVAAYLFLLGISVEPVALGAFAAIGVAIGMLANALVRVEAVDGRRFVRRSQWFLGLWGLALVALQVVSALDSPESLAGGIAAAIVGAGLVTTLNFLLLVRRFGPMPSAPRA